MSDRDAFRAEQQERRQFGKAKQQEKRLENASYTAAEVKVLTEAALRLGRKEAAEEIEEAIADHRSRFKSGSAVETELYVAQEIAHDLASQPLGAASDATSGVPRHSEVSEAPKAPQEPYVAPDWSDEQRAEAVRLVCRRCNGYGLLGVTAGVNPVRCPDCTKGDA